VDLVDRARAALSAVPGLSLEPVDERPDILKISLTEGRDRADSGLNPALRAVLAADVPVLSYEVEGARLSTAFLTMTADGGR
jgi:ABC-2 type transport system ATP-binding protein